MCIRKGAVILVVYGVTLSRVSTLISYNAARPTTPENRHVWKIYVVRILTITPVSGPSEACSASLHCVKYNQFFKECPPENPPYFFPLSFFCDSIFFLFSIFVLSEHTEHPNSIKKMGPLLFGYTQAFALSTSLFFLLKN